MRTSTIVSIAAATALAGVASYAVYFDYKRRNDPNFRKSLRKASVKQHKISKAAAEKDAKATSAALKAAVLEANIEVEAFLRSAKGAEEREAYFMQCVGNGEVLSAMGPGSAVAAASSFFKALKVYPSPVELIMIYERTVPPNVFQLIMQMTSQDVSAATAKSSSTPSSAPAPASLSEEPEETEEDEPAAAAAEAAPAAAAEPAAESAETAPAPAPAASAPSTGAPPSEAGSHEWETLTDPEPNGQGVTVDAEPLQ